jgi:ABC-type polysaccharide/polyol phosphate transport system ATPase subunit
MKNSKFSQPSGTAIVKGKLVNVSGSRQGLPHLELGVTIELENITKHFGAVAALSDVTIKIEAGSVHVLLGENGAGKTTLLSVMGGLVRPDGGTVRLNGKPIAFLPECLFDGSGEPDSGGSQPCLFPRSQGAYAAADGTG